MIQPIKKRVAIANNIDTTKYFYTVVFDMNNIMKIASVDTRYNDKHENYGMIYNSLRIIGTILAKKDFNYCIACYDGEGSGVLRWNYYKDYKANRDKNYEQYNTITEYDKKINDYCKKVMAYHNANKKEVNREETEEEEFDRQRAILQSILEELCIRQYMFDNVEGDDLISYYVHNKKKDEKVVIVSSDRDLTQLISDTVIIFNPRDKKFITNDNSINELGITHENIVLEKIICGDSSDNIKGIKGMGETTLLKLFPEIKDKKIDLSFIIERSKMLLEERKQAKKKPLKSLENIVNGVTDGCQGDKIYEINQKIIDLSTPLLTDEAEKELNDVLYGIIDTSDRNIKNVYKIVSDNTMHDLMDEEKFGNILSPYSRIIMMENKRFKENTHDE